MTGRGEPGFDLAGLAVPLAGRLVATGDRWEPYRLLDGDGAVVDCVGAFFGHLQAAGRQTITSATGGKAVIEAERICHREFLTPVRAFYLDLAQWAVDDPVRWGRWAAPCPVGRAETIQGKVQRHRKSRMDARARERLIVRIAARRPSSAP